ncbi:nardilysin [Triplophysa dalaica]|uniref:nardilysin n=1 Tax=Triplophysa dalaica TaxID=1582913 RepID=UPI0024DF673D|nr:nardilysin [Triplophysa dalaica]XP_056599850.1 nardilysin [Triplophysa dalaica]XP_056599851.1 nardilysin [Triplophysa dalaica]XP_056599852.1 nardilysin [Triplophysa dalaica]XP_056599853.1 nardilysin [Triplophysa dalaica]
MPQTNKFKCAAASCSTQSAPPDRGEPPQEVRDPNEPPGDGGGDDNQGDPHMIKSPSDPKQYRYIELSNGLRALLISDLSGLDGKAEDEEEEDSEEEEVEEEREEEEGDSGEGTDEESEEEGDSQDSDFEELDEDNDRKKRRGSEKQSAAALCIGVGSFSDPNDLPGLAHFLEHMVFMGSEKYPSENGFDAFLKKHGGSDNASTDCERTIFQFDVQNKRFKEALDRWAQFFICPLMIEDAVDREVEAVDSEYQLAKPSDSHRKEMLFGSLAKPDHPMSKFCWGNAQTLKSEPKEKNINVYTRLREFWKRYYSAHYMTLAVQSKEKLDTLEEWVREIFSQIPNNGQPKPDFSDRPDPFDTPAFNKLYRVVPVRKVHALTITWALPPQEKLYRVKPLHYIAWLIGHEGAGSILSVLRRKCWALALFGGNSETGFDQNTTYSIFSISITLTDEGYQNFCEVAHLVFQYLKMLQTLGPQQRIYEEIQKIEANEFHYQEQTDPIEYVENICENMQLFPKQDLLTGDQLMFEYKPELISAALNLLTPEKANLLLLSPEHEGQCPLREKWFGTQYTVEDIQQPWKELWAGDFDLNPSLHLPVENKFIATDFALKISDCPDTEFPVKIMNNDRGCLWYKRDNKFKIPKAYVRFHLISPVVQKSPKNLVLFDIFVNILVHNLAEPAYEADVAQLEYKLVPGEHGLVIKVKGFNHKLPLLFNLIVDYLADFSATSDVFSMFAEQLKKTYFNILIKPEKLGKDVRLLILENLRWSTIQKYQAVVDGLTVDELMEFVSSFKSELYAEGLVQGNFTKVGSMEFLRYVTDKLQFKKLPVEVPVLFRVVELPQKHHLCKVKSLNKGDANSEVTVYYQSGLKNLREHTLMELLVMHMEEPCFDFLRTKETLGYHVYPTCRNTSGVLGFSVTVETQATKFNTELVEMKIEEFLVSFREKMNSLSDEAFKTQVTALVKLKSCEDTHLGEEVDRNWTEVVTQQYVFDRLSREIDALKLMTKAELINWFMEHGGEGSRKLSVHVVGYGVEENDPPTEEQPCAGGEDEESSKMSLYGEVSKLTFLPASSLLASATTITDIRVFTSTLNLFPYHKILK